MQIELRHLFRSMKFATMFAPYTGSKREQLQSFAVLNILEHINAENLGQHPSKQGSDYFYSRKWGELKYSVSEMVMEAPYLIAFEQDNAGSFVNGFDHARSYSTYQVQIYILDRFIDSSTEVHDSDSEFMIIEEIYLESERKLKVLMQFLSEEMVFANVNGSDDIYPKGLLDRMVTEATISSYTIDELATNRFQETLLRKNDSVVFSRWSGGANDLHGVRATLSFEARCKPKAVFNYIGNLLEEIIYDHDKSPYPEPAALLTEFDDDGLGGLDGSDLGGL